MPRKFAVTEVDLSTKEYRHDRFHILWLPTAIEPDFYRQTTSFNAFFHGTPRKGMKHGPNWRDHVRMYCENDWDMWMETRRIFHECTGKIHPHLNLPQVEHKSIWDFYKYIGYDYKRKRYDSPIS